MKSETLQLCYEHVFTRYTEHKPLKYYDVKGFTQTFSIFLYDANKRNNVEIINDGKDVIIIELIIYGYN